MEVTERDVEKFLLTHPNFSLDFFTRHGSKLNPSSAEATASMHGAQSASIINSISHNACEPMHKGHRESMFARLLISSKNSSTGSITFPPNNSLKNITGSVKGVLKFIDKDKANKLRQTHGEDELFVELIKDIANELGVDELCYKILYNVSILTNSDRGSLFLARNEGGKKILESQIFDVQEGSTLENSIVPQGNRISIPFGKGIVGHAAETKEFINITNAYEDPRFNKEVDDTTGYRTHSILAMPILSGESEVLGVAMIMNKNNKSKDPTDHEFTAQDVQVFKNYAAFCGIGLHNAQLFEISEMNHRTNQLLLVLAKEIFTEQTSVDKLVERIVKAACESDLLAVEHCLVYLLKTMHELPPNADVNFDKVFVLDSSEKSRDRDIRTHSFLSLPYKRAAHMARQAVTTGKTTLIQPAIEGEAVMENYGLDKIKDNSQIKNMLTIPMRNNEGVIVGVVQLVNKTAQHSFTPQDTDLFQALAIFIGLGVHNANMYETASTLAAKQAVALEVLSYHATAQKDETEKLVHSKIPTAVHFHLNSFEFSDFALDDDDTLRAAVRMFIDSGITKTFQVNYNVLCRWICSVKKNYRPVTYHNWRHAFNVAQMMFAILFTGKFDQYFSKLEIFALLVGCLCHDLDHRGTNNAFHAQSDSPLALLYGTSTMEHHHFDHCIMILNSEGNNIFEDLPSTEYRNCIKMLESAILSTDLALYFKKRSLFKELVDSGEEDFMEDNKREMLRSMLMTACDVSGTAKPWDIQIEVAKMVTSEFFEQGDLEKRKFNKTPIAMMDRDKKDELPKMQIGFIQSICLPLYELLAKINHKVEPVFKTASDNITHWVEVADLVDKMPEPESNGKESVQHKKISIVLEDQRQKYIRETRTPQENVANSQYLSPVNQQREQKPIINAERIESHPTGSQIVKQDNRDKGQSKQQTICDNHSTKSHESITRREQTQDSLKSTIDKTSDSKEQRGKDSKFCILS